MKPFIFQIVGLQILLLVYTAQSFVMLTANMEDIKKLARKFVSDDLADKIAEFVVKATEQMTSGLANLSDENDLNLQDNLSDDNTKYKLRMAVTEKNLGKSVEEYREYKRDNHIDKDKNRNSRSSLSEYYKKEFTTKRYNEKRNEAKKYNEDGYAAKDLNKYRESKNEMKDWFMDSKERSREKKSEEVKTYNSHSDERDGKVQKYYHPERADTVRQSDKIRNNKKLDDIPELEDKNIHKDTTDRFKIIHYKKSDEKPASDERRPVNQRDDTYRQRVDPNSKTASTIDTELGKSVQTSKYVANDNPSGFRDLRASNFELTTKKEKTDFDQYDNRNYPTAVKYVATSGPVMLPKMPNLSWWQKQEDLFNI